MWIRILQRSLVTVALLLSAESVMALPRDAAEKNAFRRDNPCPSTGRTKGACPDYQVDHKQALMNGGVDKPENMQWLGKDEHKKKTRADMRKCRESASCKNKALTKRKSKKKSHPKAKGKQGKPLHNPS
jgi:hypothetical protein